MVVKCPKCNHFVSDMAPTCPHCGEKLFDEKKSKTKDNSCVLELRSKIDKEYKRSKAYLDLDTSEPSLTISIQKLEYPSGRVNITFMYDLDWTKDLPALNKAKELLSNFKQSPFFVEIEDWDEDIEEERFQCSGSVQKADAPSYVAELLSYFGLNQSDVSKSKGCFAGILIFVICSFAASALIEYYC